MLCGRSDVKENEKLLTKGNIVFNLIKWNFLEIRS